MRGGRLRPARQACRILWILSSQSRAQRSRIWPLAGRRIRGSAPPRPSSAAAGRLPPMPGRRRSRLRFARRSIASSADSTIDTLGPGGRHDPIRVRGVLTEDASRGDDVTTLADAGDRRSAFMERRTPSTAVVALSIPRRPGPGQTRRTSGPPAAPSRRWRPSDDRPGISTKAFLISSATSPSAARRSTAR